jgi:hypothetical protein
MFYSNEIRLFLILYLQEKSTEKHESVSLDRIVNDGCSSKTIVDVRTLLERLRFNEATQDTFNAQGINSLMMFNTIQNDCTKTICKLLRERAVDLFVVTIV